MIFPPTSLSSLPFSAFFFSPGFLLSLTMGVLAVPPVGGRHIATYATWSMDSGMSVVMSAGTGSATIDWNWKA